MSMPPILLSLSLILIVGDAGAQTAVSTPAQTPSLLGTQRSKVRSAVEHIRNHLCPACPALDGAHVFYEFLTYDDGELEGVKLNIKKTTTVAGIDFDVPVTVYLKNNLPEKNPGTRPPELTSCPQEPRRPHLRTENPNHSRRENRQTQVS
ncbi:MAG: hypothetical protein JNJ49_07990 [Bdellovibrionaceae bacterium]|nr:hypothetical protein [Pseudobdellovibrionaceae bacterium]